MEFVRKIVLLSTVLLSGFVCGVPSTPYAAVPEVHTRALYQSPVRADPDDLLMIPGHGFVEGAVVVYQRLADTTQALVPPPTVPADSSAAEGIAEVVRYKPEALVVRLPVTIVRGQSYALWVQHPTGEWSKGIRINDARPLWFSPDMGFRNTSFASLPRELKVMGRNLQPAPGQKTRVKLVGPKTYIRTAADDHDPSTAIEHYVARIALPKGMPVGEYRVEVSRDGTSWVAVVDQRFTVRPDPQPQERFDVRDFGCQSNDAVDDAQCIQDAVDATFAAGGGAVFFAPGRWLLEEVPDKTWPGGVSHGILVPPGVSLVGEDSSTTTIVRTAGWGTVPGICEDAPCIQTVFTLLGHNTVTGLHFDDAFPDKDFRIAYFRLGRSLSWFEPALIDTIIFTHNTFTNMHAAIESRTFSLRHLYIVENAFQAYRIGLFLNRPVREADPQFKNFQFTVEDAIVAHNTFFPGDYFAPAIGQGTMATAIGASRRLDFSHNRADGRINGGWRAAHFWHMNNSHERMLVSQNVATCTGDKAGDGEAFAYDSNQNIPGFERMRQVLAADASTVTVPGPWIDDVAEFPDRYTGHWVQVVDGKGIGQARKIDSYTGGTQITLTVSPPWDVVPDARSTVTVARQFWQVYVVDNQVDIRGCEKDNPTAPKSGVIGFSALMSDSTIEGNRLYDSDGIVLIAQYIVELSDLNVRQFQYFVEVRGNTILDEYAFDRELSQSGITLRYASDPAHDSPVVGYGVSVSHNTIAHADGLRGGAISVVLAGHAPPSPYQHKSTLIHHNHIRDVMRLDDQGVCLPDTPVAGNGGVGIHLHKAFTWDTVLYANLTEAVCYDLVDQGTNTVEVPPLAHAGSFLCYKLRASRLVPRSVTLTDQFETGMFDVKRMVSLCTPADVNSGQILDPDTHLVGYQLTSGPRHARQTVQVANQLGEMALQTRKADSLLVPSAKDLASEPPPPAPASHDVDHYKCYTAGKVTGFVAQSVRIADQFSTLPGKLFNIKRLTKLCAPVDKNGEGIKDPELHLTCYKATTRPKTRVRGVQVNNQLGPAGVDIVKEEELCVPSTAFAVTGP